MLNSIQTSAKLCATYFENPVGRLLEHPTERYIAVEYHVGPRHPTDLQDFLLHAGQLLARWGWDKLLGYQGLMDSFTPEEMDGVVAQWSTRAPHSLALLYGAQLLPHEVFARLSWKSQ